MRNIKKCSFSILLYVFICSIGNAQWIPTGTINGGVINSLIVNDNFIFAGTQSAGIFRSSNNGLSWIQINTGLQASLVTCFVANQFGIFASTINGVYVSTNNGDEWIHRSSGLSENFVKALSESEDNIYAGCQLAGVFKSANNGINWTRFALGEGDLLNTIYSINNEHYISIESTLLRSTNEGANWNSAVNGLTNHSVKTLSGFGNHLYAGTEGGLFHTANSGMLWNRVADELADTVIKVLINKGENVFAGLMQSGILHSSNHGASWAFVNAGLTDMNVKSLAVSGEYLFAGSENGNVWRRPLSEMITAININPGYAESDFVLDQNYPNPFNPVTIIKFTIPERSHVTLKIYDSSGKELQILISAPLQSGSHSYTWSPSKLSGGIYFCRLISGDISKSIKLVFMK